ncbi:MAG: glycosyltransferase family 4 protein [Lysobacterales bacterium]|jgi:glycosyltransferase involved in cell wall biosynthesis
MKSTAASPLHVCLVCIEFFGDSIYGGFGRATRFIGRELVRRGMRVSAIVPRRSSQQPDHYEIDGITVYQYEPSRPWHGIRLLRACDADIYHSQDTSFTTFLAQVARPGSIHVITFRDPMDDWDWKIETDYAGMPRMGWAQYRFFIQNPLVTWAVRRADSLRTAARFLEAKCAQLYRLDPPPRFLASPVDIPEDVRKAKQPTVCWVGRWEGRKRVELFFDLARQCPHIEFIAVGGARDRDLDRSLRRKYDGLPNLKMPGVLDQFKSTELSSILGRSWIIINTSLREGLPTTFIEAAAHRCAILSHTDPDAFASRFGRVAKEGQLARGLAYLLEEDRWRALGEAAYKAVAAEFSTERSIGAHLELYYDLLGKKAYPA